MSAIIIPFPSKGPAPCVGAREGDVPAYSYPDFDARDEMIYRMVKRMLMERLAGKAE